MVFHRSTLRSSTRAIQTWPKLTLYGDLDMRPFRNIWMLEEIGLPYQHIPCKPWSKVAKSVHPLGKVPALLVEYNGWHEAGGERSEEETTSKFVVVESAAINTFLGDLAREISTIEGAQHQKPPLVPPPVTPQRAKYESLAMFIMTELDSQSLWIHRKHEALSNVFGEAPAAVQEARRQFDNALAAVIDELSDSGSDASSERDRYLLGSFSAVDILFANCCIWAQQIRWLQKTPSATNNDENGTPTHLPPSLESYLRRCRSRPAFMRAKELRNNQTYEKKDRTVKPKL